jgi:hypothetical protein
MKFRKKPVVIEAVQYQRGEWSYEMQQLLAGASTSHFYREDDTLEIHTLEGVMTVSPGDWVIKGVKGECYPCKPDIFEATYEAVDPGAT